MYRPMISHMEELLGECDHPIFMKSGTIVNLVSKEVYSNACNFEGKVIKVAFPCIATGNTKCVNTFTCYEFISACGTFFYLTPTSIAYYLSKIN